MTDMHDPTAIEMEKLGIERQKLEVEIRKARWTAIPLVIAMLAIVVGVWKYFVQGRQQFQMAALSAIMDSESPSGSLHKAKFISAMFPSGLPANLDINASDFGGTSATQSKLCILSSRFCGRIVWRAASNAMARAISRERLGCIARGPESHIRPVGCRGERAGLN